MENRSGKIADAVSKNNALLNRLREKGHNRLVYGGSKILEELEYGEGATNLLRQAMSEVTHGERLALVVSDVSDITKLDSMNRESYKFIQYERQYV